jgi:DNA-binding transcriptional ArsR family regulator
VKTAWWFRLQTDGLELLGVVANKVRVEILKLLLDFEFRSLSEIAEILENRGFKMTLSGVLKHMKELEKAGLVRHEPGIFTEAPDARKTMYSLEGKERIEKMMQHLENDTLNPLQAGIVFSKTAKMAREVQGMRGGLGGKEKKYLESLLDECESEKVYTYLTEDEKKKLKLWRMVASMM